MDLSYINAVVNNKKLNTDGEKLREKMAHEASKIIKLRVAQDSTYWELKEKLQNVEKERETLQRNVQEMSMQYEALSAAFEEEKRSRPVLLNKLAKTREICDVLEAYTGSVRGSLRRAVDDRTALAASYEAAARRVQEAQDQYKVATQENQLRIQALIEKLKQSEDNGAAMAATATEAQRQAEVAIVGAHEQARSFENMIRGLREDASAAILRLQAAVQDRDKAILDLQSEAQRQAEAMNEFTREQSLTSGTVVAITAEFSLHRAALQKRIASLEAALDDRDKIVADLRSETQQKTAKAVAEAAQAHDTIAGLQRELEARAAALEEAAAREARISDALSSLELRASKLAEEAAQLPAARQEAEEARRSAAETGAALAEAERALLEARASAEQERDSHERNYAEAMAKLRSLAKESATKAAEAQREQENSASAIKQLMRDTAAEVKARGRAEAALQAIRLDLDKANEATRDATEKVRDRDLTIRAKDEELAAQMKTVLELRSDKERLQNDVARLEESMDIAGKELNMRGQRPAGDAAFAAVTRRQLPEHDDNALAEPPMILKSKQGGPKKPQKKKWSDEFHDISLNLNFSSDAEYSNELDPDKVDARIDALARGSTTPVPLQALKRRRQPTRPREDTAQAAQSGSSGVPQVSFTRPQEQRRFFKSKRSERVNTGFDRI